MARRGVVLFGAFRQLNDKEGKRRTGDGFFLFREVQVLTIILAICNGEGLLLNLFQTKKK